MNEKNIKFSKFCLKVGLLALILVGSNQQTKAYQNIKSWFLNSKNGSETEASIRKSRQNAITHAISSASPIVVCVSLSNLSKTKNTSVGSYFSLIEQRKALKKVGSGIILQNDGTMVTNAHIFNNSFNQIIVSLQNGNSYLAKMVGKDSLTNIALLKIQAEEKAGLPSAQIGNSSDVMVGEWSIALGNPFGVMEQGSPTASVGVISGRNIKYRQSSSHIYFDMIQTDAYIEKNNTGGPLVNSSGRIIGMNTYIPPENNIRDESYQGSRFAIPINRVIKVVDVLANPDVQLPYDPGFSFKLLDPELSSELNISTGNGLLVTKVHINSPAYESGIMPGDVIIKFGDTYVQSDIHARALLKQYNVGDELPIELLRDNQKYRTTMTLRAKIELD